MKTKTRSSRVAKRAVFYAGEDDTEYDDDEPIFVDDEHGEPLKKRKRKTEEDASKAQSTQRKVKGRRGILKDFVEMPMDVLFEIFCQSEPAELLSLSRTTKELRNILMNRTSTFIWKSAFQNLEPHLPNCPDDISLPEYADLAFGKGCHYCGRCTSSVRILWECRIRSCNKCIESHFEASHRANLRTPYFLRDYLPRIYVVVKKGKYEKRVGNVWLDKDREWTTEHAGLGNDGTEIKKWSGEKIAQQKTIKEHSQLCVKWLENWDEAQKKEKKRVEDTRKVAILDHLKKLGWGEELDKKNHQEEVLHNSPLITKACQKPLTDRILKGLESHLNDMMGLIRKKRLDEERRILLDQRLPMLCAAYRAYLLTLPAGFEYANTADILGLPGISCIINDDTIVEFSQVHLDRLEYEFPKVQDAWKASVSSQLAAIAARTSETIKNVFDLYRPSAVFFCTECNLEIHARDMPSHSCARIIAYETEDLVDEPTVEDLATRRILKEIYWNNCILSNVGFGPQNSADGLDEIDPIFECLLCHSETNGRYTMRWVSLATHFRKNKCCSQDVKKYIRLVEGPEASVVRARIDEDYARFFSKEETSLQTVCTRCREVHMFRDMLKHNRKMHSVARPKVGKDFLLDESAKAAQVAKYDHHHNLWPPFAQEDIEILIG